ncbi:hypothetical protein E1B28_011594 [Marasmius oreades]|uniref:Uncharacterized protein n=1 Tax=Marasmius oreades TaxID=181124 RepID=A0A9P7RUG4_9AGAR|nr:uncharacterized protein E1B28_011594 [Marasmius oreades]KAG7089969.1 hypothetical protein E1B28_011594 [Marasmius oreades]
MRLHGYPVTPVRGEMTVANLLPSDDNKCGPVWHFLALANSPSKEFSIIEFEQKIQAEDAVDQLSKPAEGGSAN